MQVESLKQAGFSESAVNDSRPKVSDASSEALWVWNLMGGWYPERLPVLLACAEIDHVDGLFERLLVIRSSIRAREDGRSEDHADSG